jgi:hypothetical protein
MTAFLLSLGRVSAVLLSAAAAGCLTAPALMPRGRLWKAERLAWGFAIGLALIAVPVPVSLAVGARPGWPPFLLLGILVVAASFRWRIARDGLGRFEPGLETRTSNVATLLRVAFLVLLALGLALYALRALTEPMWSNDFLAIWGLKGKMIFALREVPARLVHDPVLAFSHPEYPLGLPFLYAGIASLTGQWDDHAMAVLFPLFQAATLLAVWGWLRRNGSSRTLALGAVAILSLDAPLYAAFHTGLADIPLSFFVLLLGTAFSDALDGTGAGAIQRVALASLLAVATKNEGLFFVALALVLGWASRRRRASRIQPALSIALLLPAAAVLVPHRLWRGSVPLKDFDFRYLQPSLWGQLAERLARTFAAALHEVALPVWPCLLAVAILVAAGRRTPGADRLLALAALAAAAYVVLPAFGVFAPIPELGPVFLVQTALGRTVGALAPLAAAGIAGRLTALFPERSP